MAGEGSMLHAIITMRNNRRNRKSKFERLKNTSNTREKFVDYKKASPELLRNIRIQLQKENKKQLKKAVILTGLVMLIVFILTYIININLSVIQNLFK